MFCLKKQKILFVFKIFFVSLENQGKDCQIPDKDDIPRPPEYNPSQTPPQPNEAEKPGNTPSPPSDNNKPSNPEKPVPSNKSIQSGAYIASVGS
jgi:hypothetical protein